MGNSQQMGDEEERLVAKLQKIEALFARATTDGERAAAANVRDRIRQRVEQLERRERPLEYRFPLPDEWSRSLFIALLRRYGIEPYRYRGQRRNTVRARVTRSFVEEVLWPEYLELAATLSAHLATVTNRIISQAIHGNVADAAERPGQEPEESTQQPGLGSK